MRMSDSQLYGAWRMWPPASTASLRWQICRVEQTGVHASALWMLHPGTAFIEVSV